MEIITLGLSTETRSNILNNPAVPLSSPLAWQMLSGTGRSDSGEYVSPETAAGQSTVLSCVQLIASSISSMTPLLYERRGAGKVEARDHPLYRILALEPNPDSSAATLWSAFVSSILLWGNGFLEIARDGTGSVTGLWFLPARTVSVAQQPDGSLRFKVTYGDGKFRLLSPKDIIHVPSNFTLDGILGVSVITQARLSVGSQLAMDRYGARFFANSSVPQLALLTKAKIKPEDRTKMRQDWEMLQGGHNTHRVAILDQDLELKTLSIPNSDSQFLESRRFGREELCGLFNVKPSQIGSESRVAGETFSGQQLSYLVDCLAPWLNKIRQEIIRKLLAGLSQYDVRHDVSDRLRLDLKTQLDALAIGRQWGIYTANEARHVLDMNPGPPEFCDQFWRPTNMSTQGQSPATPAPTQTEGQND